jgi:hypothetical protein
VLDTLILHPWTIAVIWAAMYAFDYGSTLWLSRVSQTTLSRYVSYEHGVELNPNMEKAIAARRLPGLRVFLAIALVLLMILLSSILGYFFTEFVAGALLLTWCFVNSRHFRNYAYVWFLRRRPDALGGHQQLSYWLMQKNLSADAFAFSLVYLFLALLTFRVFFLAGALTCLALALRAYRLANRKFPTSAGASVTGASESDAPGMDSRV